MRYSKQSFLSLLKILKVSVNVLFKTWYLFGLKKISDELSRPFYTGLSKGGTNTAMNSRLLAQVGRASVLCMGGRRF